MALSEMEMRALEGTPYELRVNFRKKMNERAVRYNQPLPCPADALPGGVDPSVRDEYMAIVHKLMSLYGWDMPTAFRGMSNIAEDVAAIHSL